MPATRKERQDATKRQILGLLDEDNAPKSDATVSHLVKDLVSTDSNQIRLLIEDVKKQLHERQQLLTAEAQTGKQNQRAAFDVGMLKLPKATKKMTVRDFNKAHNCNLLELIVRPGKKRTRPALETPAPRCKAAMATPSRTVKRGEAIFSKNGSPVDPVEEGTLVATVAKKRRGNNKRSAVFEINVGDGRYIDLSDPGTVKHLDDDMKESAKSQLKNMQDQMNMLMAQLND